MKLIIQIPCHNEAEVITNTIKTLPTSLDGFDTIEYLVIDDGSQDDTARLAVEAGAHHLPAGLKLVLPMEQMSL
jgi:glycosyltransferase involved in cell wall biosynthesis